MRKNKKYTRKILNCFVLIIDPILLVITFALPFLFEHISIAYPNISSNTIWAFQIISAILVLLTSIGK